VLELLLNEETGSESGNQAETIPLLRYLLVLFSSLSKYGVPSKTRESDVTS
jgi:hypothetical protein